MLDVFDMETEMLIKDGISNLFWYKNDLKKAFIRSGIDENLCNKMFSKKNSNNFLLSKREIMDEVYLILRSYDKNKRIEISRNFVRLLVEQNNFRQQDIKHNVHIAEISSLRLKEKIKEQNSKKTIINHKKQNKNINYYEIERQNLYENFLDINKLSAQKRGYEFEKLFVKLMKISNIEVKEAFKTTGEQIDGAIKYNNILYLVELKWQNTPVQQKDLASIYFKVEGKLTGTRGLMISMSGYSNEMIKSSICGKELKVILFDSQHFINVITGIYKFSDLMDRAIENASLKGNIYCTH